MLTLKVDSVELNFGDRQILKGAYLSCAQGDIVGLLGRNGCGKSSLLRIIFGSLKATHKYVSIDDQFINKGYRASRIAYLPQENYLPNGISMYKLAKQLVDNKLWDDFAANNTFQIHQNKTTSQLSGGEQRQLEMLMIIYSKAPFVLLDEPFTHISPIQAEELKIIIKKVSQYKGIVLTDHQYDNILDVSSKIILISDGYTRYINNRDELVEYEYLSARKD